MSGWRPRLTPTLGPISAIGNQNCCDAKKSLKSNDVVRCDRWKAIP
jgi:hypothetical protein